MSDHHKFVPAQQGPNYQWANDHTFVKVSTKDSGGAHTLMEDNLKATFALGLHLHRQHAETFYILEGSVDFYVDGDWITATPGSTLHVPAGVPHACTITPGHEGGRMLMVFQPAGFDLYLAALAKLTDADFADVERMRRLNEQFDIIELGPVPERA